MFVAMMALPAVVAAQTPPPPPALPPVPAMPAPVAAPMTPVPPRTPRPVIAPMPMTPMAIEDAMLAAQAVRVDTTAAREAAREATMQAREAMEHAGLTRPMTIHLANDFHYAYQDSGDSSYSSCLSYISSRKYDEAVVRCDRTIQQKGTRTDAAMYWKAYAQYRLRQNNEALATIGQLRKEYPQSRYLQDAKVLENDVRRVDPTTVPDDDLKILAIQGVMNADPERGVQLAEGLLNSTNSLRVKKQALYLLAQSTLPRARQAVLSYAKGQGSPDLQLEAIRYLQTGKDRQSTATELKQIYESTTDIAVRRAVIQAYTETWNTRELTMIASTPGAPMPLRTQAVSGLANVAAPADLWSLYTKETDKDLKMQMISAFGSMQALDQLTQIVKTEKEPAVRARAVRALGNLRPEKTGQILADLYSSDQDLETRKAVVSALSNQNNAEGLVTIARKEGNLELKRMIVERLSSMAPRSKVAADYLMEIIK
jgi:hypothetical protein